MKTKIKHFLLLSLVVFSSGIFAQNNSVGIGTTTPDNSAILDLFSTNQGLLIPRNNTSGITTITAPSDGLILYNTDDKCYWFWNNSAWKRLCDTDSLLTMINNLGDTIGFIYDSLAVHNNNISNLTTIVNNHSDSLDWIYDSLAVHNTNIFNNTSNINNLYDSVDVINNSITNLTTIINNHSDSLDWIYDSLAVHNTNITNNTTNIATNTTNIQNLSDSLGWVYDSLAVHNTNITTNTTNISNLYDSVDVINTHLGVVDSTLLNKWDLYGNTGTIANINFLGTKDNIDLVFRTNNTEKVRVTTNGRLGIGTNSPTNVLDINSNALRLRNGATANYVLTTNAIGVGTWQDPSLNPILTTYITTTTAPLGNDWKLGGNSNVNLTNNILGSLSNFPIDIRTSNIRRLHIDENGNFNIGFQNIMANVNTGNAADASFIMGWRNNVTKGSAYVIGYDNTIISTQNGNGGFFFGNNWTQNVNQVYNFGIGDGRNVDFLNQNGSIVMSVWDPGFAFQPVVSPTATGQFIVRTNNGATIYSGGNLSTGVFLTTGSGTWASVSDKNVKTNIIQLNYLDILNKYNDFDISKWSYKSETSIENKEIEKDVYHIGVMAQDFYNAFGLGTSNKLITSLDVAGVNMAAIKALIAENNTLKERLEKIELLLKNRQK